MSALLERLEELEDKVRDKGELLKILRGYEHKGFRIDEVLSLPDGSWVRFKRREPIEFNEGLLEKLQMVGLDMTKRVEGVGYVVVGVALPPLPLYEGIGTLCPFSLLMVVEKVQAYEMAVYLGTQGFWVKRSHAYHQLADALVDEIYSK
jgi:hypothetical protein